MTPRTLQQHQQQLSLMHSTKEKSLHKLMCSQLGQTSQQREAQLRLDCCIHQATLENRWTLVIIAARHKQDPAEGAVALALLTEMGERRGRNERLRAHAGNVLDTRSFF
jgi:hypothetical protein